MIDILPCMLGLMLMEFCFSTILDADSSIVHNDSSSNVHLRSWNDEASFPIFSRYIQTSSDHIPNIKGLLSKYHIGNRQITPLARNPHFSDLEFSRKTQFYQQSEVPRLRVYEDYSAMHSIPDHDIVPQKKHDYVDDQNYGGWDSFPGGLNFGSGAGLVQIGHAVKKGKEAKALFFLMAPLILLAVFGPLLATQAMIPWIANGGLTSVSAIAGGSGKRKKRTPRDPRQMAELEKRLHLFLAIQDFIARTGSTDFAEEMGEAFLSCQKYTERRNKCLERIACEYTDETSIMDPSERRIAKMVLQNVMANPMIAASIKGRLSKGSTFGKNQKGRCRNYWCEAIDGPKRIVNHK